MLAFSLILLVTIPSSEKRKSKEFMPLPLSLMNQVLHVRTNVPVMLSCSHPGCGGTFTDQSGYIISPNYPKQYDNNMNCTYLIQSDLHSLVLLTSVSFHLEGKLMSILIDWLICQNCLQMACNMVCSYMWTLWKC